MELLTPRQTKEVRPPTTAGRVTIPDPSDTLGDPVVEQTVRKLIETAGRLVANRSAPGSSVTAPYGTIDDTGRVELSQETMKRTGADNTTLPTKTSEVPDRKKRVMPMKNLSRVLYVQKNNQVKNTLQEFRIRIREPASIDRLGVRQKNMQQSSLATSHSILGDSLVRVLQKLRTSWITTVMAFGGTAISQLYRMVELMNPGIIPNLMILVGKNNVSRGSDEEEAQWEPMMVCLITTLCRKFKCAVLTVCTVPMSTRTLTSAGRRNNKRGYQVDNIVRNLASRNAGRMILMDIEHELRALDQARLTTDGIHFDSIERQAWLNQVFQERQDELEVELFDKEVLKKEETMNEPALSIFVPPNLETRLGSVPAVTQRPQNSNEPGQRVDALDRLGEAPVRWTIHPRRRLGPSGTSRLETTSSSREERRPDRSSLMWSRPIPSPWHVYKQDLMKLNLQTVKFAADAIRMLNGARLSVNGLYSIAGLDWLIAAGIRFSSTTALRFAYLEGLPSNNTMGPVNARPLQDVRMNHSERNREERPGRFLTTRDNM